MAPPEKDIDFQKFEELCGLWCTQEEIANILGIDADTLRSRVEKKYEERYSVIYKRYFDQGVPSFRRERRVMAATNPTMSIWLGKIHLGEREDKEVNKDLEQLNSRFEQLITYFTSPSLTLNIDDNNTSSEQKS